MDIKQLRYFATIANEGQISRAARKLHMAQPPLSQQLKLLEEELGTPLFERKGRRLELTAPGKVLYKKAVMILNLLEETVMEVKETEQGLRGVLRIGSVKSGFSHLIRRIRRFREQYPMITFQLREGDSYRICELLRNRDIEIGLVRLPIEMEDVHMIHLPIEPYVAVLPKDWQIAAGPTISMKDVKDLPLLLLHRISGIGQYEMVIDECRRHGFEPNVICECPDVAMLLSLVNEGVGATIVPKSAIAINQAANIQSFDIEDSTLQSESAVIWLKDRYLSKAARHFLETFTEQAPLEPTE
ncbi:MAG: LysR family transcriptional regulator [Bacillaceae bacterium G1]|nr:MAG: LysR family transcriptional regulator [Bacillaceae bacterium G1]